MAKILFFYNKNYLFFFYFFYMKKTIIICYFQNAYLVIFITHDMKIIKQTIGNTGEVNSTVILNRYMDFYFFI